MRNVLLIASAIGLLATGAVGGSGGGKPLTLVPWDIQQEALKWQVMAPGVDVPQRELLLILSREPTQEEWEQLAAAGYEIQAVVGEMVRVSAPVTLYIHPEHGLDNLGYVRLALPGIGLGLNPEETGDLDLGNATPETAQESEEIEELPRRFLTVPGQYPTIQAAIDAAEPGDTVFIGVRADGTFIFDQIGPFVENVRITKPLTLAAPACSPSWSCSAPGFVIQSPDPAEPAVTVVLDEGVVQIYGLGLTGGEAGLRVHVAPGAVVECGSIVVWETVGLEASGGGTARILNSLISRCFVGVVQLGGRLEIHNTEVSGGYMGILVGGETELELSDCTITDNAHWPILTRTQDCGYVEASPSFTGRVNGQGNRIRGPQDALLCPAYPGEPWPDGFVDLEWVRAVQEAVELVDRGDSRYEAEDFLGALALYEEALAIVEHHPYPVLEARLGLRIAEAESSVGKLSSGHGASGSIFAARGLYLEVSAVALRESRYWRDGRFYGMALQALSRARDALAAEKSVLTMAVSLFSGDRMLESLLAGVHVDVETAALYAMLGRYDEALDLLVWAAEAYELIGQEPHLARVDEWIGLTLEGLGGAFLPTALEHFQRARQRFAQDGKPVSAARLGLRIGTLLLSTAGFDPDLLSWAREEFEEVFDVFDASGMERAARDAAFGILIAEAYEMGVAGAWDEAYDFLVWLLQHAVWARPESGLAEIIWGMASIRHMYGLAYEEAGYSGQGFLESALEILDLGLERLESDLWSPDAQKSYLPDRMRLLHLKGAVLEALGRWEEAAAAYRSVIEIAESVRGNLAREQLKVFWGERMKYAYVSLIDLLHRMGQGAEAFPYAERSRARTFLDILYGGGVQPEQLISPEAGVSAGVVSPEAIDEAVGEALAYLEPNEAVLSYFTTERGVYLWVIAWDEEEGAHVVSEPIFREYPRTNLLRDVIETRKLLETPSPTPAQKIRLGELLEGFYDALVLAGLDQLPDGVDTLVLVPSGPLWYVPFAALAMTDQPSIALDRWATRQPYLVERYTLAYLPSVASLSSLLERTEVGEGIYLGLADPELTADQLQRLGMTEAQYRYTVLQDAAWAFAQCQGGEGELVYVGTEATEGRAHREAPGQRVVVYGAHGQFNPYVPLQSALYLAPSERLPAEGDRRVPDGAYRAWEILLTDHRGTELVVLAACESLLPALRNLQGQLGVLSGKSPDEIELTPEQLERITTGDEVVGMARAFLSSGAHSVLGTLWQANPGAIALLLASVCRHQQTGLTWAQALRQAQIELADHPTYAHPWFWAPFQLVGRWR